MLWDCEARIKDFSTCCDREIRRRMDQCQCSRLHHAKNSPAFIREIVEESPTRRYSRANLPMIRVHWGQMKLLISEIEFLTPFYGKRLHVVYAGAAPGIHMLILADMFPTFHFIMVDPAPFMPAVGNRSSITLINDFMTDELARKFREEYNDELLFICDIRVGAEDARNETDLAQQERIHKDMEAQRGWVRIMRPESSMLKFRLPWNLGDGKTQYAAGIVRLPVYGKRLTHEARLIVDRDAPDILYDNALYEGQMAYFNQVLRPSLYPSEACVFHMLGMEPRYDSKLSSHSRCYDCTAFQAIVAEYLVAAGKIKRSRLVYTDIEAECIHIEVHLTTLTSQWQQHKEGNHEETGRKLSQTLLYSF